MHQGYHRKGHEWQGLWKLHRTHPTTPDMNVGIGCRENILWFVPMPNLCYGPLAILLGMDEALGISTMVIDTVLIVPHSGLDFDRVLYQGRSRAAAWPHHPPEATGIERDPEAPWYVQLYWPFVEASDPTSEFVPAPVREAVRGS